MAQGKADDRSCNLVKFRYDAKRAQIVTDEKRSEARKGACLLPEEMVYLDDLVSPMVVNGQSVYAVFQEHGDALPCSQRTLYHYIDRCYLTARNLDLPRKVRYKTKYRRKRAAKDYDEFALGRTYFLVNLLNIISLRKQYSIFSGKKTTCLTFLDFFKFPFRDVLGYYHNS